MIRRRWRLTRGSTLGRIRPVGWYSGMTAVHRFGAIWSRSRRCSLGSEPGAAYGASPAAAGAAPASMARSWSNHDATPLNRSRVKPGSRGYTASFLVKTGELLQVSKPVRRQFQHRPDYRKIDSTFADRCCNRLQFPRGRFAINFTYLWSICNRLQFPEQASEDMAEPRIGCCLLPAAGQDHKTFQVCLQEICTRPSIASKLPSFAWNFRATFLMPPSFRPATRPRPRSSVPR